MAMSPAELAEVKDKTAAVLARHPKERGSLIPLLQEVQEAIGYLPREAMESVADHINVSPGAVYGVATFYAAFSLVPRGKYKVCVCLGTACHVRGAPKIVDALERELDVKTGGTTEDRQFSLETVRCLGCCGRAPVLTVNEDVHGNASSSGVVKILDKYRSGAR